MNRNLGRSEQEFTQDEFAVPEENISKESKNKKNPERWEERGEGINLGVAIPAVLWYVGTNKKKRGI